VLIPRKPFQSSLLFVSKAGAYQSGAPFRGFRLWLAPGLTSTH
jgi:hypothetical protein